jgi:hypothetical protein
MADSVALGEELKDRRSDFEYFVDTLEEHRSEQMLWRDFYDGYQLTEEEEKKLERRKQPAVVYNRIQRKVDYLIGLENQTRRDPKAFPRTPIHAEDADSATDALRYVAEVNRFKQTKSQVFTDILIEGEGGVEIIIDKNSRDQQILVKKIPWDRIWYDPHSRLPDYSDAGYKGIALWMDMDDAKRRWGTPEQLASLEGTDNARTGDSFDDRPTFWVDQKRNRILILQEYYKKDGVWYFCEFVGGGFLTSPVPSVYLDDKKEPECPIQLRAARVDREGRRYGEVKSYIDPQKEVNKRRSKALHLLNVNQIICEKGVVQDINKARQEINKPDGVVELNRVGNEQPMFEVRDGLEASVAHFNMMQEAKNEIDALGANAAMTGEEARNMSGVALQARQTGGTIELGSMFDALKEWEHRVYRTIWNRVRQFWTEERWVRVTDDERNIKWAQLNQPITVQMAAEEMMQKQGGLTPEAQAALQANPNAIVAKKNNVSVLDIDIIIDDAPDSITIQEEQFAQIVELAKSRPDQIPFEMIIEASTLRNKEQLLERMKTNSEQQSQLAQIMQKLDIQAKELDNMKTQADIQAQQAKAAKESAEAALRQIEGMMAQSGVVPATHTI